MILKQFAELLNALTNKDIVVGRWGGEEFVIITSNNIKYNDFVIMLEKLRIRISKYKFKIENKKTINITTSIGSTCSDNYEVIEETVKVADDNLYKAKNSGRNKLIS